MRFVRNGILSDKFGKCILRLILYLGSEEYHNVIIGLESFLGEKNFQIMKNLSLEFPNIYDALKA